MSTQNANSWNTKEVADKYWNFCKEGNYKDAYQLFDENAQSWEPEGVQGPQKTEGIDNLRAKFDQWQGMVKEIHNSEISEPLVAGNHFTLSMKNDITYQNGVRVPMEEVCVFEVENGKIVKEQFFYPVPPTE